VCQSSVLYYSLSPIELVFSRGFMYFNPATKYTAETAVPTAHVDKLAAPIRVVNSPRSRDNRAGQIRLLWPEESLGVPRSLSRRTLAAVGEGGQDSLNACGV
jgi:hypothetical protein